MWFKRAFTDPHQRSKELLFGHLSVAQKAELLHRGYFTVRGNVTGERYGLRISGAAALLDKDDHAICSLCFWSSDREMPILDQLLAKKLALECAEDMVLGVADYSTFTPIQLPAKVAALLMY